MSLSGDEAAASIAHEDVDGRRAPPRQTQPRILQMGPTIDNIVQAAVRAMLLHEETARDHAHGNVSRNISERTTVQQLKNSEIAALLPEFLGIEDDADAWIERIDAVQAAYQINDDVIQLVAVSKLTGQAKQWFHSKLDFVTMPWETFKLEFKNMFSSRPSKIQMMRKFESRRWRKNEKFSHYYSDKVTLGNRAGLDEVDMVEYLIDGMDNQVLQSQARMQQFASLSELLTAMKNVTNEDRYPGGSNPRSSSILPRGDRPAPQREPNPATRNSHTTPPLRCYNCNGLGHRASECRKARRQPGSCFECGETDHMIKDCPRRQRRPATRAPADSTSSSTNLISVPGKVPYTIPIEVAFCDRNRVKCSYSLTALIDTGSPISIIKSCYVPTNSSIESVLEEYTGVNGSRIEILGVVNIEISVNNHVMPISFYVIPDNYPTSFSALLGRDFISLPNVNVNFKDNVEISFSEMSDVNQSLEQLNDDVYSNEIMLIDTTDNDMSGSHKLLDINGTISPFYVSQMESDLNKFYILPPRPNKPVTDVVMKIRVNTDHSQFFCHPRRLSYADKLEVEKIVNDLLSRGIICKSSSPYSSPIVLVKRKDKIRMCVDYRVLNKITQRDNYPLPLIEDHIDCLRGKKWFTRLDLKDAFHHVDVDQDSVKFTSFVTPFGQFSYRKMPFGLKNSPSCFARFVNVAFRDLIDTKKVLIYVDDILVATETIEENLKILRKVYEVLVNNKLELRLDKCSFLKQQVTYLGYSIDSDGIRPSRDNIAAIVNFPIPTSYKTLQSFIGLASYFRKFIDCFSLITKPLYELMHEANDSSKTDFIFGEKQLQSFERIKTILTAQPLLRIYSPTLETQLHCDACQYGIAAILVQKQPEDSKFHPVFYFSKRTTTSEQKYHSFELEALAIVSALERFKIYLQGIQFKIITDCNSLKLTLEKRDINPRILRWSLTLHNFDYSVEHRNSSRMKHVDALSRCILILEENTFERNLALMQNRDSKIQEITRTLEKQESPSFELRDGLVYKKFGTRLLFYVPDSMVNNVIRANHDDMGHVGIHKVIDLLQKNYWFPNMNTRVKIYIENCLKCITFSPHSGKTEGLLHPIPKGNIPFDTIHADHQGPFEPTSKKYRYIFEVIDGFTKFVKLYPCKTTNSAEIIKHLLSYFHNYDRPRRIIADRGAGFRSAELSQFMTEQNIQLIMTAKNTPRANGQIERINRDLTPMIAKLAPTINKWDCVLQDVEFSINNTKNRSTGTSPSLLLFGVRQKGKINDMLREYLEDRFSSERDLLIIREEANQRICEAQERAKQWYDRKHKEARRYEIGDYVMCTNYDTTPGVCKKHLPKYRGPYEITQILPNDRYLIEDVPGFQVTQRPYRTVVAASDIKPWITQF